MSTSDRDFELASLRERGQSAADTAPPADLPGAQTDQRRRNQAQQIVDCVHSSLKMSRTPSGEAFASFDVRGHLETWPVRSRGFSLYLRRAYFTATDKAANARAITDARDLLEATALFDAPERDVYVRVAATADAVHLDLADERWRVVEVTADRWQVLNQSPVLFRRARGMLPLPVPRAGGSLGALRGFVNVATDEEWALLLAWLAAALRGRGPFPVLALHGEQGSAKSTTSRMLRALLDPNAAALRAAPRDARDLAIAAANGWVVALDNLSTVPPWLSDALCRLSTGGGFATRELYSDSDETIFDAQRPVLLNGIEELATRGDLLDRAVMVTLPPIPESDRRPEQELWRAFEETRPALLGALLDAVARALRDFHKVKLARLPRMADFAVWATAAEPALGLQPGTILRAYEQNRSGAVDTVLDASPVSTALQAFFNAHGDWTGTATELLKALDNAVDDATKRRRDWPGTGRALSGELRRLAPTLRAVGLDLSFDRDKQAHRRRLVYVRAGISPPSTPSADNATRMDGPDCLDGLDGRLQHLCGATAPDEGIIP